MSTPRTVIVAIAAVMAAAALQAHLYYSGFYSITGDESGRTLDAYFWSRYGVIYGTYWLPFYRVVVGAALAIWPDLFLTPRVVTSAFGLAVIPVVGWLTHELFQQKRLTQLSIVAAALFPQRVVLSLAPLSSILFSFLSVTALALFARWQRTGSAVAFIGAAFVTALACTARFEGWLFAGTLLVVVGWTIRQGGRAAREAGLSEPVVWLITALLVAGPMSMAARQLRLQANSVGAVIRDAQDLPAHMILYYNPAVQFLLRNGLELNLIGLIALFFVMRGPAGGRIRLFAFVAFGPLLALSAGLWAISSVQTGQSWRMVGVWGLLTLPFTCRAVWWLRDRGRAGRWGAALGVAALLTAFMFELPRLRRISRDDALTEADRAAGAYLRERFIAEPNSRVLIESSHYVHQPIVVCAQTPERFIVSRSPSPKMGEFALMDPTRQVSSPSAGLLMFRSPEHVSVLERDPSYERVARFGPWGVYESR